MSDKDEILNETEDEILNEIDKKIFIRLLKEGKATRTYIEGLNKFFKETEAINMSNTIKKKLATSYFYKKNFESHGFNGDHKLRLKDMLHKDYKIPLDKIIMC